MMNTLKSFALKSFIFGTFLSGAIPVEARPEYSVKHHVINCMACHTSPSGGGSRNTYGKLYGSHSFQSTENHEKPWFQVDARALGYVPQSKNDRGGLALMSLIGAVNIELSEIGDTISRFVASYDFANFQKGLREAYIQRETKNHFVQALTFGLFTPPFGLLSDEHRVYTRIQSHSTYNHQAFGAMITGGGHRWQYRIAATNDLPTSSPGRRAHFSNGLTGSTYADIRTLFSKIPMMLGASGALHYQTDTKNPYAFSIYTGINLDQIFQRRTSSQILVEYVEAKFLNTDSDLRKLLGISGSHAYNTAIQDQVSQGWSVLWNWDWSPRFRWQYRWDRLLPAKNYDGDTFERYGLGFNTRLSSNSNLIFRVEHAKAGRPDTPSNAMGNQDAVWFVYHLWL